MYHNYLKIVLTILIGIIFLTMVGCGFSPYPGYSLPTSFKKIYYQKVNSYELLDVEMRRQLRRYGIVLVPTPNSDAPILNIEHNYTYNPSGYASSSQARIYELTYEASVAIDDYNHCPLMGPELVTVSHNVILQPNEVFDATPRIDLVKAAMRMELLNRIFYILNSPRIISVLNKHYHEN